MASTPITSTVIAIDIRRGALHYYSMLGTDRTSIVHLVKNYAGEAFTEGFYQKFKDAIISFVADQPSETVRKISVVVPDEAAALDVLRLPILRSTRQLQNAVEANTKNIFKNKDELKILTSLAERNKQYCAYTVAAIRKDIISSLSSACSENKLLVDSLTFSSASVPMAITALNPKMKNESYLFLDIKDIYSRFIFVAGGKTVGFFTLPFGLEYLGSPEYIQEDMLFDHTLGEITVLNAHEKAKAKKLTLMRELSDSEDEVIEPVEEAGAKSEKAEEAAPEQTSAQKQKVLAKKTPRKLPAFMLRPIPVSPEEMVREKFRVFMKWGIGVLEANPKLVSIGEPKCVLVNLPPEYQHVIDAAAAEEKENGIEFRRFTEADGDPDLALHLELFGGLNSKLWHTAMKF